MYVFTPEYAIRRTPLSSYTLCLVLLRNTPSNGIIPDSTGSVFSEEYEVTNNLDREPVRWGTPEYSE
jgi:hypothetical protein